MSRYDAAVVGAGPAGSLAALILARAGRRVVLLEKARFPRPKTCGACLNPRAWPLWQRHGLAESFAALEHGTVNGLEIARDGQALYQRPVAGDFRAVDRAVLDAWLAEEARRAGAEFRPETPVRRIGPDGRVDFEGGSLEAEFVLCADGRTTLAAPRGAKDGRVGWQLILSGVDPAGLVRMNVFPGGYYGVVGLDQSGTRADLAMVLETAAKLDPRIVAERFFPGARVESALSTAPISRPPARPAKGRVWLLGDAARVVEPFTGEGIYFALASAEAAAETLRDGWGALPETLAKRYRRRHRALYAGELRVNRLARWLLARSGRGRAILGFLRRWPGLLDKLAERVLPPI